MEVPRPKLDPIEPAFARRLEQLHDQADRLRSGPGTAAPALAAAFGDLGKHYAAFGFLDAATAALRNAEAAAPTDRRWPHFRGLVAFDRGDLEAAAVHFEQALELAPEAPETALQLGIVYSELQRPDAAERILRRALDLDPSSAAVHQRLGQLAAARGEPAAAIERFVKALDLAPEASVLHYSLGLAYRDLGELDAARSHLERQDETEVPLHDPLLAELTDLVNLAAFEEVLARIAHEEFSGTETLAFALRYLGDLEGNVEGIERYLEDLRSRDGGLEPSLEARFYYLLGGLLARRGDSGRAIERWRAAIRLEPRWVEAHLQLGNALARAGRGEEAVRHFTEALDLEPGNRSALVRRATAYVNAGRYGEATADLRQAVELLPGDATTRTRLAVARLLAGDRKGFERQRRKLAELDLTAAETEAVHFSLAGALLRDGRPEEAAGEYRVALRSNPESVRGIVGLANLDGHFGRTAEALRGYRKALAVAPEHRPARLGEIVVLLLTEHRAEARLRLETALRELPPDTAFAHALARLLAIAPEATLRNGARALELIRDFPRIQDSLEGSETAAMVYAEVGEFDQARELQRKVAGWLESRSAPGPRALFRQRLQAYEAGRPWRAASADELILSSATPAAPASAS